MADKETRPHQLAHKDANLSADEWTGWHSIENIKAFVEKSLASNQITAMKEVTIASNEQLQIVAHSGQSQRLRNILKDIQTQSAIFKKYFQVLDTFIFDRVTQQGIFPRLGYIWFSLLLAEVITHAEQENDTEKAANTIALFYELVDHVLSKEPNLAFSMYGVFQAKRSSLKGQSNDFFLKETLQRVLREPEFKTDEKSLKRRKNQAAIIVKIQTSMEYWKKEIEADDWNKVKMPVRIITVAQDNEQREQYPSRATDQPDTVMLLDEDTLPSFEKIGLGIDTGVPDKRKQLLTQRIVPATLGVQVESGDVNQKGNQFFTYYDLPAIPTIDTSSEAAVTYNMLNLNPEHVVEILTTKRVKQGTLGSLHHLAAIRLRDNIYTRFYNLDYNNRKRNKIPNFDEIMPAKQVAFQRQLAISRLKKIASAVEDVANELTKEIRQQVLDNTDGKTTVRNSMIAQAFIDEYGLFSFEETQTADKKTQQWAHIERVILEEVMTTAMVLAVGMTTTTRFYDEEIDDWREVDEPFLDFSLSERPRITAAVKENWLRSLTEHEKVSFAFVMLIDIHNTRIDFPGSLRQKLIHFKNDSRDAIAHTGGLSIPELSDEEHDWLLDYFAENTHKIYLRWQTIRNKSMEDVDNVEDVM